MKAMRGLGMVVVIAVLPALLSAGCASIAHGRRQEIKFSSVPPGAQVSVNGINLGMTPLLTNLKRKTKEQVVRIELDGFEPYQMTLKRKVSGWYFGNLVFGGVVGLIVDPSNGAMYRLKLKDLKRDVAENGASVGKEHGKLHIRVALNRDPNAERIGTLRRLQSTGSTSAGDGK